MNYYFAPLIPGLETCVTLVNFPPVGGVDSATMDLYAFAAWPVGSVWHVQELGELKRGESEVYRHADIPGDFSGKGIVIFFLILMSMGGIFSYIIFFGDQTDLLRLVIGYGLAVVVLYLIIRFKKPTRPALCTFLWTLFVLGLVYEILLIAAFLEFELGFRSGFFTGLAWNLAFSPWYLYGAITGQL